MVAKSKLFETVVDSLRAFKSEKGRRQISARPEFLLKVKEKPGDADEVVKRVFQDFLIRFKVYV